MVATTGARLLPSESLRALRASILPLTTILTPNLPEAKLILEDAGQGSFEVKDVDGLETIARALQGLGPQWVLVKGGHIPFTENGAAAKTDNDKCIVVDVLAGPDTTLRFESRFQGTRNTHGTGCSLACKSLESRVSRRETLTSSSAAIASNLAKGLDVPKAVKAACQYIEAAIRTAPGFGQGSGPLNHFHSTMILPFSP